MNWHSRHAMLKKAMIVDIGASGPASPLCRLGPNTALAEELDAFVDRAVAHARKTLGPSDLREAWNTFRAWITPPLNFGCDDWRLFLAWYVFHWRLAAPAAEGAGLGPTSIAASYLEECRHALPPEILRPIEGALQSPLDFYEIHCLPDLRCYYVKSLFLGLQHSFAFSQLPPGLLDGCVFFAKIVHLHGDQGIILGRSRPFPAEAKGAVSHLRFALIRRQAEDYARNFWLFDSDIFDLYHEIQTRFPLPGPKPS